MDREYKDVLQDALALDRDSQIALVEQVSDRVWGSTEIEQAWLDEAERRRDAYRRGEIDTVDSRDVMARARQKIEQARNRQ
jgi:hypothetical protein